MSRKIDTFRNALGNPLTIHNFIVSIPDFQKDNSQVEVVVSATSLPSETMRDIILYYLGERVKWPTIPTNSGEWTVSIPENEEGMAFVAIMKAKNIWWKQKAGVLLGGETTNIDVIMRTVNDEEVFRVRMHNCYCKGRADVSLSNNDPTTPFIANATFSYDWIEDISLDSTANEAD